MSSEDTLILFGIDSLILYDTIRAKLKEKEEREKRIAEAFLRIEALLNENSQKLVSAREGQP